MPMTPTGWRLVPVEATKEMLTHGSMFEQQYQGALDAAPDPLQDERLIEAIAQTLSGFMTAADHAYGEHKAAARAVLALFRGEGK